MTALNFPAAPADGAIYPTTAVAGVGQWQWSQAAGVWQALPFYMQVQSAAYNNYLWPTDAGENGQVLTTDGGGGLSWSGTVAEQTVFKQLGVLEAFDGVNTSFTLVTFGTLNPYSPYPSTNLVVFLGGVPQVPGSSYTISTNTITFSEAPAFGASFFAFTLAPNNPSQPVSAYIQLLDFAEAIDGVRTAFTLEELGTSTTFAPSPSSNLAVFLGGVPQVPVASYSVSGDTVTFTEAPGVGASAYAISTEPAPGVIVPNVIKLLSILGNFNGVDSTFTLTELGTTDPYAPGPSTNIIVFLGGVPQEQGASYDVSGSTITFSEAPSAGSTFYALTCFSP